MELLFPHGPRDRKIESITTDPNWTIEVPLESLSALQILAARN